MNALYKLKRLRELSPQTLLIIVFIISAFLFIIVGLLPSILYKTINISSYLTFHIIIETFSIIVSFSIFGVGYYTYNQSKNKYALFLSCAFLAIGIVDMMHMLSFPGMPAFITPNNTNKGILFWISARLIFALALIISVYIYTDTANRWLSKKYLLPAALIIPAFVFVFSIYFPTYLPLMFIEGSGLTVSKLILEWLVIVLFTVAFILYWRRFLKTKETFIILILAALIIGVFSELSFTLYKSAYDTYNMLGHIYKLFAFILIYASIFYVTISQPYNKLEMEIDERKKAEQNIRMLADVVESSEDAIITKSLEGSIISWNKGAEMIYGYSAEEVLGKNIFILSPPHLQDETKQLIDKIKNKEHIVHYETERVRKDGKKICVSLTLSPVYDSLGNLVGISTIARDITDRKNAENQITQSLKEKEVLLKEIHHRVKNNLQIISSLLDLQESYVKEDPMAVNVLKESQNRVKAMAGVYEKLYLSKDLTKINFNNYVQSILQGLFYSHLDRDGQISPEIEIEDIMLNIDTAIPCGLIISELVSNSLKHAFPEGKKGKIGVSLRKLENKYELKISDNGIGFPKNIDFRNTESLGLKLVNNLVKQIDGEITLDRSQGTEFIIIFKELKYKKRI